jgi:hypothetical protein
MARTPGAKDKTKRKTPAPVAEWRRCTARSKQSGERCKRPAAYGGWVCRWHGGEIPQVIEATRDRLGAAVPLAVARMLDVLEFGDDALACRVASDLLNRLGLTAPVQLSATVEVNQTVEVESLLGQLAAIHDRRQPSKEERIVEALAESMGLPADLDPAARTEAVFDAVVGVEAEPVDWQRGPRSTPADGHARNDGVEDAEIVVPEPIALPPARRSEPDPVETITIAASGASYPGAALSHGGRR